MTNSTSDQGIYLGYEITGESWRAWIRGLQAIETARAGLLREPAQVFIEGEYIQHLEACIDRYLESSDNSYLLINAETPAEDERRLVFASNNPNATRAGLLEILQVAASRQLKLGTQLRGFRRILCAETGAELIWVEHSAVGGINNSQNNPNRITTE